MTTLRRIKTVIKRVIGETFKGHNKPLMVFLIIIFLMLFCLIASSGVKYTVRIYYYEGNQYQYHTYQVAIGRMLRFKDKEREGYDYEDLFYDNLFQEKFGEKTLIWTDTHLFARYINKEYLITLDHNDGTGAQNTVKVRFNEPLPEPAPPEKQGYLFAGYFEPDEGKRIYSDTMQSDTVWGIPKDITIYARWVDTQNIVFDKQGGEGGSDFVVGGLGVTLQEVDFPTKEDYKFNGYYSQPDGQGKRYYAYHERQVWDHSEPQTLYAYWSKSIFFDKQGGSGGTDSVDAEKNKDLPSAIAPYKEGYTFDGYYLQPNGKGKQYYSKDMTSLFPWDLDDSNSVTLYANWLINYTVTLQHGSGQNVNIIVNKDRDMPVIPSNLVREGYLFAGYYSMPEGKGIAYYDAMCNSVKKWDRNDGGTLYPHWVAISGVYTKTQDYIIMGEYPQTIASPQAVSAMRPLADGYYISDFDGAKYVMVKANPFDTRYKFTNNETIAAQQEYYFKIEPIKWRILQEADGRIYVMSVNILDKGGFNSVANNNWEKAYLREWLNKTFYAKAFSSLERVAIAETQLNTQYTFVDSAYLTKDKIFLPSYEDMKNADYGFEANDDASPARAAVTTDYARALGVWMGRRPELEGKGYYWLRSGFHNSAGVRVVFADGNINNGYYAVDKEAGIRPAMYIKTN